METESELPELLVRTEQQVARDHTFGPAEDNALATWRRVIKKALPGSPETAVVLRNFVTRARKRTLLEVAAGRLSAAESFAMFADLGEDLLTRFRDIRESPFGSESAAAEGMVPEVDRGAPEKFSTTSPGADAGPAAVETATAVAQPVAVTQAVGAVPPPSAASLPFPAAPAGGQPGAVAQAVGDAASPPAASPPAASPPAASPPAASPSAAAPVTPAGAQPVAGPRAAVAVASPPPASTPVSATPALPQPPPVSVAVQAPVTALAAVEKPARLPAPSEPIVHGPQQAAIALVPSDGAIELHLKRGDDMLAVKDISAARKFYIFAANAGSARAAAALARTYDPAFLPRFGVIGLKADPAKALEWYHKAAELGDADAAARLRTWNVEASR